MQRRMWMLAAAIVFAVAGGCSSATDPLAVEFTNPFAAGAGQAQVVGVAVDEGMVCSEGTFARLRMEDADGVVVSEEDGAGLWDEALVSGATLEMTLHEEFSCSDGSGSLSIVVSNVVQPSVLDFEGTNDVGTWEIEGGTGAYEGFSGQGDYVADFGTGHAVYTGEIQEG